MSTRRLAAAAFLALLAPALASAAVTKRVPIVTQVQGAVFYRTFLMIANASDSPTAVTTLTLTYRSPADGTLQVAPLNIATIPAGQAETFDDIIQTFKDSAAIRTQDLGVNIFGSLQVTASGLSAPTGLVLIARTYSPANEGGTNGIAYVGRASAGSATELVTFVANGDFGESGVTRANIGIVNESGTAPTDLQIAYRDASNGVLMKQFRLSDLIHRSLGPGEVDQLNNIFADPLIPPTTQLLRVEIRPVSSSRVTISGYAVQLDSVTNDGSFFLMTEVGGTAPAGLPEAGETAE